MKETILKQYIRDKYTNHPHGVAVAVRNGDTVEYGFSLCNKSADKWDKDIGTKIAIARSQATSYQLPKVSERANLVLDAYEQLQERAIRYFKEVPAENIILRPKLELFT